MVSVIIPCYNHGRYLRAAIASVLAQTYDDFEIIVVDDGSTDDSVAVCQQYGSAVQCVTQANSGPAAARNRGLEMARGDWIQFLDADDLLAKDKLATQLRVAAEHPDAGVICCSWSDFAGDVPPEEPPAASWFRPPDDPLRNFVREWYDGFSLPIHTALVRRDCLFAPPWFSERVPCEDWLFWVRLVLGGVRFAYHSDVQAYYRQTPGSRTSARLLLIRQHLATLDAIARLPIAEELRCRFVALVAAHRDQLGWDLFVSTAESRGLLCALLCLSKAFPTPRHLVSRTRWRRVVRLARQLSSCRSPNSTGGSSG